MEIGRSRPLFAHARHLKIRLHLPNGLWYYIPVPSEKDGDCRLERKITMRKLIMLATAFAAAMPLVADTETVGGYTWTYEIYGDTAEIVV